jgi:hypothetical protein
LIELATAFLNQHGQFVALAQHFNSGFDHFFARSKKPAGNFALYVRFVLLR